MSIFIDKNKTRAIFIIILLCLTSLMYYLIYIVEGEEEIVHLRVLGAFGVVQFLFYLWSWKRLYGNLLCPYILFFTAAFVFTFGQSFLLVFNAVTVNEDLINRLDVPTIYSAQIITLLFLGAFHIGAIMALKSDKKSNREFDAHKQIRGLKYTGWILFTVSFLPFILESINQIAIVNSFGYGGLYEGDAKIGFENISAILADYFIPSILCLIMAYHNKKIWRSFLYIVCGFYILLTLYLGGRSDGVILLIILLLMHHYLVKPLNFIKTIAVLIIGYVFISFLSVIAELRSDPGRTVQLYSEAYFNKTKDDNLFLKTVSEMGGTMYPLAKTMELVPKEYPFRYGTTYMYAVSSIIPNIGFWELHPAMKNANLGGWLQKAIGLTYGPGYSLVAEAYINFGNFGFLFMVLYGFLLSKFFMYANENQKELNPLSFFISILFCFLIMKTTRNSFLATVRAIFYIIIPIVIMVRYIFDNNRHKKTVIDSDKNL